MDIIHESEAHDSAALIRLDMAVSALARLAETRLGQAGDRLSFAGRSGCSTDLRLDELATCRDMLTDVQRLIDGALAAGGRA